MSFAFGPQCLFVFRCFIWFDGADQLGFYPRSVLIPFSFHMWNCFAILYIYILIRASDITFISRRSLGSFSFPFSSHVSIHVTTIIFFSLSPFVLNDVSFRIVNEKREKKRLNATIPFVGIVFGLSLFFPLLSRSFAHSLARLLAHFTIYLPESIQSDLNTLPCYK